MKKHESAAMASLTSTGDSEKTETAQTAAAHTSSDLTCQSALRRSTFQKLGSQRLVGVHDAYDVENTINIHTLHGI